MGQIAQQLHKTLKGSSITIGADSITDFIAELERIKDDWEKRMLAIEHEVIKLRDEIKNPPKYKK